MALLAVHSSRLAEYGHEFGQGGRMVPRQMLLNIGRVTIIGVARLVVGVPRATMPPMLDSRQ
jgi:hypothetical protein